MAVNLPEVLNNLFDGNPQQVRALLSVMPVIRLVNIGTPGAVGAAGTLAVTLTLNGVNVGDAVMANKPTEQAGLAVASCRVSAQNTIIVNFVNPTAGGITPTASEIYKIIHIPAQMSGLTNFVP